MSQQLPLCYPIDPLLDEEHFLPASSNAQAVRLLAHVTGTLLLFGPQGSGKSHLATIWQKRHNALRIDASKAPCDLPAPHLVWEDADKTTWNMAAQENAFHALNMVKENGHALLITATTPPAQWPLQLADLRSRLLAIPVARLEAPDDALTAGLILKHVHERQLRLGEDALNYLVTRAPRDGAAIATLIETLDKAALAQARALTIPFIKTVIPDA